jgi:hypothetical protein
MKKYKYSRKEIIKRWKHSFPTSVIERELLATTKPSPSKKPRIEPLDKGQCGWWEIKNKVDEIITLLNSEKKC